MFYGKCLFIANHLTLAHNNGNIFGKLLRTNGAIVKKTLKECYSKVRMY